LKFFSVTQSNVRNDNKAYIVQTGTFSTFQRHKTNGATINCLELTPYTFLWNRLYSKKGEYSANKKL